MDDNSKKNEDKPVFDGDSDIKNISAGRALIWEDGDFNFFTIIDGKEVFIGRGKDVPYPLEEGDLWSLANGRTFRYKNGAIKSISHHNQEKKLRECLETLYEKFEESYLYSDPLGFVHKFDDPKDVEVAGFIAAGFAFGSVGQIIKILDKIDKIIGHKFYEFTINFDAHRDIKLFDGFYYRFIKEKDITALFLILSEILRKFGSIEKFFLKGYIPSDLNLKNAITNFSKSALELVDFSSVYNSPTPPKGSMVHFFFTSPRDNSPCKRINLFLRWMVRNSDNLDFGIWRSIQPYQLIMPVDTHIGRICQYIGLTKHRSTSFKMAEEITENLKKLDYYDPIKYDFAITRLGILDLCTKIKNPDNCEKCSIFNICKLN